MNRPLNLFYEEPEPDRWIKGDRFPRRIIRRIVRGKPRPGGQMRVFLNLCSGLDRLGVAYRVNDYRHLRRAPRELACVVGKPHVLSKIPHQTPMLFGAAGYSHPLDDPDLLSRHNVRAVLVPSEWMRIMCEPYWGDKVEAWPVGIDTELWRPDPDVSKDVDIVVYDKIQWRRDEYESSLLRPVLEAVSRRGLRFATIRYGAYREADFIALLKRARAMIYLTEHETQGLALLQTLSCDMPILAWDRGGYWQDPSYFPHRVKFAPVTTVPYWDERCGQTFRETSEVSAALDSFWSAVSRDAFSPRSFVVENLTLEKCARRYVEIARRIEDEAATA